MVSYPGPYDESAEYHVVKSILQHTSELNTARQDNLFRWIAIEAAKTYPSLTRDEQVLRLELLRELAKRTPSILEHIPAWIQSVQTVIDSSTDASIGELYRPLGALYVGNNTALRNTMRNIVLRSPHATWVIASLMKHDRSWVEEHQHEIIQNSPSTADLIHRVAERMDRQ